MKQIPNDLFHLIVLALYRGQAACNANAIFWREKAAVTKDLPALSELAKYWAGEADYIETTITKLNDL